MGNEGAAGVSILVRQEAVVARMTGALDEQFNGSLAQSALGPLVIDLDGVRRVTSSGVRKWLEMLKGISASFYCFVNCRPAMVTQFNLVRNFGGKGAIVTLYAPFVCEACSQENDVLIDVRRQHAHLLEIARAGVRCADCGEHAYFDDHAEDYFDCVLRAPTPKIPPAVAAIVDGREQRLKISKDVREHLTVLWLTGLIDGVTQFKRVADGLEGQVLIVLQGVTGVTQNGFRAFRTLTEIPGIDIVLGRLPLTIALGLQASDTLGRAGVASMTVPLTCPSCLRTTQQEVDREALEVIAREFPLRSCACGANLQWPEGEVLAAARLPWTTPDAQAFEYLEKNSRPYSSSHRDLSDEETMPTMLAPADALSWNQTRYQVLNFVAEGGMGVVYRGRLAGAGGFERRVAIKRIHRHLLNKPEFVAMFLDEARLAARIHHPNVVSVLDVEHGPEGLFLVMEYIDGCSAELLVEHARTTKTPLPAGLAARITLDMLAGLHAAHELRDDNGTLFNLIHRDVSPQNLLVGLDGVARLTDFGVARADHRLARTTQPGELKGKVSYLAPEQLSDGPIDLRTDVYAAGVVAWELLVGRWLFVEAPAPRIILQVLEGRIQSPRDVNPFVPPAVSAACMVALARDPSARYSSAAAFSEAIERACDMADVPLMTARAVGEFVAKVLKRRA